MPANRDSAASRGYGSKWQKFRAAYLANHPLCVKCDAIGRTEPATVVDHIEPHRGDWQKFWHGPFQALCKTCHDRVKQAQEHGKLDPGCNADGWPIDPAHHWNRGRHNA